MTLTPIDLKRQPTTRPVYLDADSVPANPFKRDASIGHAVWRALCSECLRREGPASPRVRVARMAGLRPKDILTFSFATVRYAPVWVDSNDVIDVAKVYHHDTNKDQGKQTKCRYASAERYFRFARARLAGEGSTLVEVTAVDVDKKEITLGPVSWTVRCPKDTGLVAIIPDIEAWNVEMCVRLVEKGRPLAACGACRFNGCEAQALARESLTTASPAVR